MEEISTLTKEVSELDAAVAEATDQRKVEHSEYVDLVNMNAAALGLVEKAKNRLQKFYNPTLYKAPPKTENTMEEKIIEAGTYSFFQKKTEKAGGVLALMDMITKELGTDMKDAEYDE